MDSWSVVVVVDDDDPALESPHAATKSKHARTDAAMGLVAVNLPPPKQPGPSERRLSQQ